MPRIDFSQTSEFELIPAGQYRAELEAHQFTNPSAGKNGQLRLQFRLTEDEVENRRLSAFCTITPASAWYMKMCLVACGMDPEKLTGNEVDIEDEDIEALYDASVSLTVSVDSYGGKERNKIDRVAAAQYAY